MQPRRGAAYYAFHIIAAVLIPLAYTIFQFVAVNGGAVAVMVLYTGNDEAFEAVFYRQLALLNIFPGIFLIGLIVVFAVLVKRTRFHVPAQFSMKTKASIILLAFVCGVAMWLATTLVFAFPWPEVAQEDYAETMELLNRSPWIFTFIFGVIMAPVAEELVYRAGLFHHLKKILPLWLAVAIQAVVFGLIHMDFTQQYMNLQQGIYAAIIGVVLAIIYHVTKSITAPVVMHISLNFVTYYIEYVDNVLPESVTGLMITGSVPLTVALVLVIYNLSRPRIYDPFRPKY